MPRPVHAQGRPGTEVIPHDWAATHRPAVAKTFTATCTIRHPGGTKGPVDTATGTRPTTPHPPHYPAPAPARPNCRIQVLSAAAQERLTADEDVSVVGYLVVLEAGAAPDTQISDLLRVVAVDDNGDPTLVGRDLIVTTLQRGSLVWERDLICTDRIN